MKPEFKEAADRIALEEGAELAPLFGGDGLITAVVSDADSGILLMVAHMNADALAKTLETGEAWYWSRSRGELWHKGVTSGTEQEVVEIRVDCDQDAVWLMVRPRKAEGTCHTGRKTCFYRRVEKDANGKARLRFVEHRPSGHR